MLAGYAEIDRPREPANCARMQSKEDIQGRLKALRHKNSLRQEDVAAEVEVKKESVSAWETGKSLPSVLNLPSIARLYGVTIDYIVTGKDPKPQGLSEDVAEFHAAKPPEPRDDDRLVPFDEIIGEVMSAVEAIYQTHGVELETGDLGRMAYNIAVALPRVATWEELRPHLLIQTDSLHQFLNVTKKRIV